jgi:Spy/CpxP family protein refolding chaperone
MKIVATVLLLGMFLATVSAQDISQKKVIKGKPMENASTQPSPPPPPPPPPPPDMDDIPPLIDFPDLTDQQKEKIRQADLKHMETMTPLKNQMREKRARLATILATPPADISSADKIADEIGRIQASMLKETIRYDQVLRTTLTPDQQIMFDARPKPFLNRKQRE